MLSRGGDYTELGGSKLKKGKGVFETELRARAEHGVTTS